MPITPSSSEATEAAVRTAVRQLIKLVREPVVAVMHRHIGPNDDSMRKSIGEFLKTPIGTAMLQGVIAGGLEVLPLPENLSGKVALITREMRVGAMAMAGDAMADLVMDPFREMLVVALADPKVSEIIRTLPDAPASNLPAGVRTTVDSTIT